MCDFEVGFVVDDVEVVVVYVVGGCCVFVD